MSGVALKIAIALVVLAVADRASCQLSCIGDCAGDGVVRIDDLMVGVTAVLSDRPPTACGAWDPDGDQHVTVYDLVGGIASALDGACHPPPTPDPLLEALDAVWESACVSLRGPIYRDDFVSAREIHLLCEPYPGHEVHLNLLGYAPGNAPYAFQYFSNAGGFEDFELGAIPARYEERYLEPPERFVRSRVLVWQLECWVGRVSSLDGPAYTLAADPRLLSTALIDAAGAELAARCASFSVDVLGR